jgi:hypothetical protein
MRPSLRSSHQRAYYPELASETRQPEYASTPEFAGVTETPKQLSPVEDVRSEQNLQSELDLARSGGCCGDLAGGWADRAAARENDCGATVARARNPEDRVV